MNVIKFLFKSWLPEAALLHLQALDHYLNGEDEIRLVRYICPAGRVAVDAGANIGTYSYFFRKYASQVFAYEPNPGLADRLRRVMPDIQVRAVALSDKPGEVVLKVPFDADGQPQHELASIAQEFDGRVQDFPVQALTLDAENLQDVGIIKVDVEQHERQVLRGALQTIARCRPFVMTEISPLKYEQDLPAEFAFITQLDYAGWFKFAGRWHPLDAFDRSIHACPQNFDSSRAFIGNNLIFMPRESGLAAAGPKP
jgi:FkbM family methyltransferase